MADIWHPARGKIIMKPMLSVIMSVYNGESYLKEAVDSIINQTYKNWELIIIDDCSTDSTPVILAAYQDSRIRILKNEKNLRLAASLNLGLSFASGNYILRMDADDICRLDRFEKQLAFMEAHPSIDVSWGKGFWFKDKVILKKIQNISFRPDDMKAVFLFTTPIMHNCVIAKKVFYDTYSYLAEYTHSEDWNLWYRGSKDFQFAGQNEYLVLYRIHNTQTTDLSNAHLLKEQYKKNFTQYIKHMGLTLSQEDINFHVSLICDTTPVALSPFKHWLTILTQENERLHLYKKDSLIYSFLWEINGLYRANRLTKKEVSSLLFFIGIRNSILFYSKKILNSCIDVYKQRKQRNFFPAVKPGHIIKF